MKENNGKQLGIHCNPILLEQAKHLKIHKGTKQVFGALRHKHFPEPTPLNWNRSCKENLVCIQRPMTRKDTNRGQPYLSQPKNFDEGMATIQIKNVEEKNLHAKLCLPKIKTQIIEPNNGKPRLIVTRGREGVNSMLGEYQENMNLQSYDFNKEKRLNSCVAHARNNGRRLAREFANTSRISGNVSDVNTQYLNSPDKASDNKIDFPLPLPVKKENKKKANYHKILRKPIKPDSVTQKKYEQKENMPVVKEELLEYAS